MDGLTLPKEKDETLDGLWIFLGTRAAHISPRVNRHVAVYAFAISFSFGDMGINPGGL